MKNKIVCVTIMILCILSVSLAGVLSVYRTEDRSFTKEVQKYIGKIVESFEQNDTSQ